MSIADRIAANQSQPTEPKPSVTNTNPIQTDQFWKSVKGPGLVGRQRNHRLRQLPLECHVP